MTKKHLTKPNRRNKVKSMKVQENPYFNPWLDQDTAEQLKAIQQEYGSLAEFFKARRKASRSAHSFCFVLHNSETFSKSGKK